MAETSKTLVVNTSTPGTLDLEGNTLTGLATPSGSEPSDVANVSFVNSAVAGGVAGESIMTPVTWANEQDLHHSLDLFTLACSAGDQMIALIEVHAVVRDEDTARDGTIIAHALYKYDGTGPLLTLVQQNATLVMQEGASMDIQATFGVTGSKATVDLEWGASLTCGGTVWAKMQSKTFTPIP
jgi:hypothetical protein